MTGRPVTAAGLHIRGLNHQYAVNPVLEDIHLDLSPGQVLALVGPSGCGKTTLLHLCAGLLVPREGRIDNRFSRPAVVFQQPRLLPWKNAGDNIAVGLKAAGLPTAQRRRCVAELGQRIGLDAEDLEKLPASSPAACRAAWPWPAPWCWNRICCCWMSPSRPWISD